MGDVPPSMTDYDDDGDDDRRLFPLSRIIESSLIKTAAVAQWNHLLFYYPKSRSRKFQFNVLQSGNPVVVVVMRLIISTRRWAAGERAIQQSN